MKAKITSAWEERSKKYKDKIEGVLPKSLPRYVNDYLDEWMYEVIKNAIDEEKKVKILDLGCGFGRISKRILKDFPKANIIGIDIAKTYVDIYNNSLNPRAKAYVGDIKEIKFKPLSFDVIIIVTTLMYITVLNEQIKVIKKIKEILKKNGKVILIERNSIGYNIINLGGLIPLLRGSSFAEIESTSFYKKDIVKLLRTQGFKLLTTRGLPVWTLFLPAEILIGLINKRLLRESLKIVKKLDSYFYWLLTPSMYISYIVVKDEDS